MAVERIDSLYDVQAITAEQQQVVGAIDATQAKLVSLWSSIQTNNKSTVLDIAPNANELSTAINNLSQKINALSTNLNVMRQAAKNSVGGMTDLEKAQLAYQKSIALTNAKIQGYKLQTEEANKAAKAAAKEALNMNDAYQKLQNTYIQLQREAKNAGVEFGTNSVQFKTAAAAANAAGNELKNIDGTLGQFNRNVGNYKSGFSQVGSALQKGLAPFRTAANILPGLGISGIFLGIAEAIGAAVIASGLLEDKFSAIGNRSNVIKDALGSTEYKKAIEDVSKLRDEIDLANKGYLSQKDVLKDYNDTLGATLGYTNDLSTAEQNLISKGEAFIKVSLLKAAAMKAQEQAADELVKSQQAQQQQQDAILDPKPFSRFVNFVKTNALSPGGLFGADPSDPLSIRIYKEQENEAKKHADVLGKIATDLRTQAAKEAKAAGISLLGNEKQDNGKDAAKSMKDSQKAEYDALKAGLEAEAKLRQSFADNQASFGEQGSIEQAKQASALRMQIIDLENKHDLDQEGLTKTAKEAINKKYNDERSSEEITLQANIAKIQKAARDNQLKEDEKAMKEVNALGATTPEFQAGTARTSRIKEELSIQQGILADATDSLTIESSKQLDILNQQYVAGAISLEDYEKKKKDLTSQYSKDRLKLLIAELEAELKIYEEAGLGATASANKVRAAIATAKKGLSDINADTRSDKLKQLTKDFEQLNQAAELFAQTVQTINDIGYEKQKAQLESLENQQEKSYEKEVENINNSTLTEEQKANKLKILESQRQAQKDANDRKQRQLDNQKARFDKASSIMSIITNTALAVVKALPNIGLAILSGALGAAQLAKAIATPIPQYAEGTENHPGGAAWVGDGGEHELVQERSGKTWITPNTPTLVNLAKGAKVTPLSDDLNKAMYNTMLIKTGNNMRSMEDMSVREQTRMLSKAFKNNRPKVTNNIKVDFGHFQYIQSQIKN